MDLGSLDRAGVIEKRMEFEMPKLKTDRGAAKRFRRTASGFKHRQANRNHNLTKKAQKRKRQLRGLEAVAAADARTIDKLLPKKAR